MIMMSVVVSAVLFGFEYLLEWFLYYKEKIIGIFIYKYVACREREREMDRQKGHCISPAGPRRFNHKIILENFLTLII